MSKTAILSFLSTETRHPDFLHVVIASGSRWRTHGISSNPEWRAMVYKRQNSELRTGLQSVKSMGAESRPWSLTCPP